MDAQRYARAADVNILNIFKIHLIVLCVNFVRKLSN